MANFLRMLVGLALLPACWGVSRAFVDALLSAAGATGGLSIEALSLLGGIAAFAVAWMAVSHPVKAYVLGHELTHAMWGLLFGARPSDLKVGAKGGWLLSFSHAKKMRALKFLVLRMVRQRAAAGAPGMKSAASGTSPKRRRKSESGTG